MNSLSPLGLGIGWRPEIALAIQRRSDLGFVEVVAENLSAFGPLPVPLEALLERGVRVIPHGISLSLGSAEPVDLKRIKHLAALAKRLNSPLVSEHIAFVRAGGLDAGHLLPLPRTREAISVLVENVKILTDALAVPLALENISSLFEWPDAQMSEPDFVSEVLDKTGAMMLLDVSNVYANTHNLGGDPLAYLAKLPLHRLAYVHVGGGSESAGGVYHDTHAHPTPAEALNLLNHLSEFTTIPAVMLERDDNFPPQDELFRELDAIALAMKGDLRG